MAEGTPWLEDGSRSPAGTSSVERGGGGGGGGASAPGPGPVAGARAKLYFFFFWIGSQWGIQDFDKGGPT